MLLLQRYTRDLWFLHINDLAHPSKEPTCLHALILLVNHYLTSGLVCWASSQISAEENWMMRRMCWGGTAQTVSKGSVLYAAAEQVQLGVFLTVNAKCLIQARSASPTHLRTSVGIPSLLCTQHRKRACQLFTHAHPQTSTHDPQAEICCSFGMPEMLTNPFLQVQVSLKSLKFKSRPEWQMKSSF